LNATSTLTAAVLKDGQNVSDVMQYPNYSLGDTPIANMYGSTLPRLKALRTKYDPTGVMLRTGGPKFV